MDRRVWHATVHRVTKSQTSLKQLSTHALPNLYILHLLRGVNLLLSPPFSFHFLLGAEGEEMKKIWALE